MKKVKVINLITLIAGIFALLPFNSGFKLNASTGLDFHRDGSLNTQKLSGYDLYSALSSSEVSESEKNYINSSSYELLYENPNIKANLDYDNTNHSLTIKAEEYTYTDINKKEIIWTPSIAKIDTREVKFLKIGTLYEANFTNLINASENVEITYSCNLNVSKENADLIINQAYYEAEDLISNDTINKKKQKYQDDLAAYEIAKEEYEAYLSKLEQYNKDLEAYNEYLSKLEKYNEEKKAYDEYVTAKKEYDDKLAAYNQYLIDDKNYKANLLQYNDYLEEKKAYDERYAIYEQEYATYASENEQSLYFINAMKLIKTKMTSLNRSIYEAVIGGTVDSVLANKDDLKKLSPGSDVYVDNAYACTVYLRKAFADYYDCDTNKERFNYLRLNYGDSYSTSATNKLFLYNLEGLLVNLEKLYRMPYVAKLIESKEKTDKYLILLSQLSLVCNALDNNEIKTIEGDAIINDDYKLTSSKTVFNCLENKSYFVENNTYNISTLGVLEEEPAEPLKPLVVKDPGSAPTPISHPGEEIKEVKEPTNIDEVKEPTKLLEVKEPTKPVEYVVSDDILNIIDEYNNKTLVKKEVKSDVTITLTSSTTKNYVKNDELVIWFLDYDENVIAEYSVSKNGSVIFDKELPSKKEDEIYSEYEFSCWVNASGEKIDLNNIEEGGYIYPKFVGKTLHKYEIIFVIDGIEYKYYFDYGTTPTCEEEITKKSTSSYYYTFKKWDKEISSVTKNEKYTALFDAHLLINNTKSSIEQTESSINVNLTDNDYSVNLTNIKQILNKDNKKTIVINNKDYSITLPANSSINNIDLSIINSDGLKVKVNSNENDEVLLTLYNSFDMTHTKVYDENDNEIIATIKEDSITFKATTNHKYSISSYYNIYYTSNEELDISVSSFAKEKSDVGLSITPINKGTNVDSITIKDANGNVINYAFEKFVMPSSDVYISYTISKEKYLVEFIVEGIVYDQFYYYYGEIIDVPKDPIKADDENYTYTFKGWDKEISTVSGEEKYTAIFEKKEKPKEEIIYKKGYIQTALEAMFYILGGLLAALRALFILKKFKNKTKL